MSAGHPADAQFSARLIGLLRRHEVVATNTVGAHVFFALAAGCRLHMFGDDPGFLKEVRWANERQGPTIPALMDDMRRIRALAADERHDNDEALRAYADAYLRRDALLGRDELRAAIAWSAALDRRGTLFTPGAPPLEQVLPRLWYREAKRRTRGLREALPRRT